MRKLLFLALILSLIPLPCRADLILQENAGLPITVFNITFRSGSADDPPGQEGLAFLTARLLREGGVKAWKDSPARSRAELEDFLFPMAADISVSVQKEQTSFQVIATAGDAPVVLKTISQVLLAPAFSPSELERLKAESLDALQKALPREDEEELGKAALDRAIYGAGHPYAHVVRGTVEGVKAISLKQVEEFYKSHFVQRRLILGIAGVIDKPLAAQARALIRSLPRGSSDRAVIPPAPKTTGRDLLIVKGPFDAVGVHLGLPVPFTRASPDFPSMYLASTAFGKHRSFVGRLMRVVREMRGLNYGDYSYVEDFPNGGEVMVETTQVARSRQAFTVWGRPTPRENGCFLLRQLTREVHSLSTDGLTADEFSLGQSHLVGNVPLLGASLEKHLGYAIDSRFYGVKGDYLAQLAKRISGTSLAKVNALLKKHIASDDMHLVVVTSDPEKLKAEILSGKCEIHYAAGVEKPKEVTDQDKIIGAFPLGVAPERIKIIEGSAFF